MGAAGRAQAAQEIDFVPHILPCSSGFRAGTPKWSVVSCVRRWPRPQRPVSRGPLQQHQEQTWMLRRIWGVKSPSGAAGSIGDAEPEQSGQLGMLGTSRPAVAAGVTGGRKCANLTFSCSLKWVFVCPDVQRRVDVRELTRHLLHMARTTSQTCESRHHAECSVNTDPGRPPTRRCTRLSICLSSLQWKLQIGKNHLSLGGFLSLTAPRRLRASPK